MVCFLGVVFFLFVCFFLGMAAVSWGRPGLLFALPLCLPTTLFIWILTSIIHTNDIYIETSLANSNLLHLLKKKKPRLIWKMVVFLKWLRNYSVSRKASEPSLVYRIEANTSCVQPDLNSLRQKTCPHHHLHKRPHPTQVRWGWAHSWQPGATCQC